MEIPVKVERREENTSLSPVFPLSKFHNSHQSLPLDGSNLKPVVNKLGNVVCRNRVRDVLEDKLSLHDNSDFGDGVGGMELR